MKSNTGIDFRIAKYAIRKLNGYIALREGRQKAAEHKEWTKKFGDRGFMLHSLGPDLKIKLYRDSVLSSFIYDGFEANEIGFLNEYLNPGDYFVDIGSNIGLFSLYASKKVGPTGMVIAFEPASETFKRMTENIQLNNIENIRSFKLGLSDKDDILELNVSSDGHEAWNTFVQSTDNKFSSKEKVQVKSLDNILAENSIEMNRISLVKLDVEGFEINVLKGASHLLSSENAPAFMVEFTEDNAISAGNCCHELYKLLIGYDYTWFIYDLNTKKLIPEPMRLSYVYSNLIAIKNANLNDRISRFRVGK